MLKYSLLIIIIALCCSCSTSGAAERILGEGDYEVRVWDGKRCDGKTPDEKCEAALRPLMNTRAVTLCGKVFRIENCRRKGGMSGDRLYCDVNCTPEFKDAAKNEPAKKPSKDLESDIDDSGDVDR